MVDTDFKINLIGMAPNVINNSGLNIIYEI